jgi:hypothetical protein
MLAAAAAGVLRGVLRALADLAAAVTVVLVRQGLRRPQTLVAAVAARVTLILGLVDLVLQLFVTPTLTLTPHLPLDRLRSPTQAGTKSTHLPVAGASPSNGFHNRRSCSR